MSFATDNLAELFKTSKKSPLQELTSDWLSQMKVRLFIKRDDLLFLPALPEFRGNKWRKMKYNLLQAAKQKNNTLLTFGGAYSNHIAATAAAGRLFGFDTIGVIRGEETLPLNPTLSRAKNNGMRFHYVSRTDYREKGQPHFIQQLRAKFGDFYLIPEGGSNALALSGCHELGLEIQEQFPDKKIDYICAACGTGGTFSGLITAFDPSVKAIGFPALKGDFMADEVTAFLAAFKHSSKADWSICNSYHFGGFARYKPELIRFMLDFYTTYHIALDPLYTGKLFFGIFDKIKNGFFPKGSIIIAIHSGGIQGISGFNKRYGLHLPI